MRSNIVKKALICTVLLILIYMTSGCSKNDSTQEIKVRKSETGRNESGQELKSDPVETKFSDGNSTLQKISSKDVRKHIGDSLTVTGYIADVYLGEKVAYLNFEDKFPKNAFTCTIFPSRFSEFGDLSKYKNKNAEVTGKITTYKNKPQIILESEHQIKIIQ